MNEKLKEIKNGGYLADKEIEFDVYDDILSEEDFSTQEPNPFRIERIARAIQKEKKFKEEKICNK